MRSAILLGTYFIGYSIHLVNNTPVRDIDTMIMGIMTGLFFIWDFCDTIFKK